MNTEKILTALYESYTNLGFVLTEGTATAAAAGAALYNQRTRKSRKKDRDKNDDKELTEAIYNSFVDMAYVLIENQTRRGKGRLKRPNEGPASGKVTRKPSIPTREKGVPRQRTTVAVGATHLTGAYGDNDKNPERVRARMRANMAKDNAMDARPGAVADKTKRHYAKLHKRANAGDAKAKELLRRAEMSGND